MPRPRCQRKIGFRPKSSIFKPIGIPAVNLEKVILTKEEAESYRLRYLSNLDQTESADKMKTSQSTFQRILTSASRKIADSIINGKALVIEE
jgi:predicted DNA-binding protein (UPF0251 family)